MLSPRPLPCPTSFVVKNGSNTCCIISGDMPVPVSVTASSTYSPGVTSSYCSAQSSSRTALRVSSVSVPALRIASRELTARLTSACSSSPRSANAFHRCGANASSMRMLAPNVRLVPREREQAMCQLPGAAGRPKRIVEEFPILGIAADALLQELQIAHDNGEQVVEIVCDAAGELAHCFHLLRLPELLFDLFAFSDVLLHRDKVDDPVPVLDRRDRGQLPEQLAVLLLVAQLA